MSDSLLLKFLTFRLKQIGRLCREVGWGRTLLLVTLLVSFFYVQFSNNLPVNGFVLIPFYLLILPLHFARKDYAFLRKLDLPKEVFLASEYNILVLPLTIFIAYSYHWSVLLLGHFLVTLAIFIPSTNYQKKKSTDNKIARWIPAYLFEWRSYLRQRILFLIIVYLLSILLSSYTYTVLIGILLFLISIPEVFNYIEPKELIESYAYSSSSSFLSSKIKYHSLFIHLLLLPLYILFLILHLKMWSVLAILITVVELSICFCLVFKYSRFQVSTSVIRNQISFAIFFISLLLFFPIGLFFIYWYWKKAQKALPAYVKS